MASSLSAAETPLAMKQRLGILAAIWWGIGSIHWAVTHGAMDSNLLMILFPPVTYGLWSLAVAVFSPAGIPGPLWTVVGLTPFFLSGSMLRRQKPSHFVICAVSLVVWLSGFYLFVATLKRSSGL